MHVLYNVTVSIDPTCETEWLEWMRSAHIPEVMNTGCFLESRLSKVHGEEEGGVTYAVTYVAYSQEHLDRYGREFAPALQADHSGRFNGRFAAFRTTLSVIEHFVHER
ncbi:MAG: DUF4286 family protein [Flavobacteriia bacterium]|nr:DUF4286 family protein [Flavobacteriia bacterium]